MKDRLEAIIAGLIAQGVPAFGEVHVLAASNSTAVGTYMQQWADPDRWHNSLSTVESRLATGRNDVVLLTPESHSLAAALTWDLNLSHLCGMYTAARMNHRTRIGHSANITPMITVSGYGNTFANLYTMHGRGSAANLVGWSVTGARNTFLGCHFAGPMHATEGDQATYNLFSVANCEQYFKGCCFGIDTVAWTNGDMVKFRNGSSGDPPRSVFEDCIFLMNADNAQVRFLCGTAGLGEGAAIFRNCTFINTGTSLDYAIDGTGLNNFIMVFDQACTFVGCTEIVELAYENYVWCGCANLGGADWITGGAAIKLGNMLASHPDVS